MELLKAYGFSDAEIRQTIAEYSLNAPIELIERTPPPGIITVLHGGSVSKPFPEARPRELLDLTQGRIKPEDLLVFDVTDDCLLDEHARAWIPSGSVVYTTSATPMREGRPVLVEEGGTRAIITSPLTYAVVTPSKAIAEPKLINPGKAKVIAQIVAVALSFE